MPCIIFFALTTFPPYACAIDWWPKHIPNTGILFDANFISSTHIPASSGVLGPGDIIIPLGFLLTTSIALFSSFLKTSTFTLLLF